MKEHAKEKVKELVEQFRFLEKRKFIQKYRKDLNDHNPYALKCRERMHLKIERNIALKFLIVTTLTFIFIYLSNYFFNNPVNDWIASIYVKYINFPLSDADSARYFFSAVPQSLAALLAISFTVLLIYLQISVDRYSIQTVRYVFHGWGAVTVLSIFLITIIYSFFKLGNIRDMGYAIVPGGCAIYTTFVLTVLCGLFLILFFYKTISSLTPENFILQSSERIKKASIVTLDFMQLIQIKNSFFKNKINNMENVEEPNFFVDFGLPDSKHCIKTSKRGFVRDIDVFKIDKCSKLLSSVSDDCKLQLKIPIEGKVSSASNVLGFIEGPNSKIISKVERLVKKAYKIDNKKAPFGCKSVVALTKHWVVPIG